MLRCANGLLAGRTAGISDTAAHGLTYGFDQLNRVTTATENGTFLLAPYIYDALSQAHLADLCRCATCATSRPIQRDPA